jgi:hypothetical protein
LHPGTLSLTEIDEMLGARDTAGNVELSDRLLFGIPNSILFLPAESSKPPSPINTLPMTVPVEKSTIASKS